MPNKDKPVAEDVWLPGPKLKVGVLEAAPPAPPKIDFC